MTRTNRLLNIALLMFVIAMVVCSGFLAKHARASRTSPMAYLGSGSMKQLALARSAADIQTIVGNPPDAQHLRAIRRSLEIDTRWFIPLYTVALILVVIVTGRGDAHVSKAMTIALAALVVVAAIFDVLENRAVGAVADHLAAASVADGLTADFWLYAVGKWLLVGLVFVAAGTMNLMQRTALRRFGGGLMIVIGMSIATELLVYGADRLGYR